MPSEVIEAAWIEAVADEDGRGLVGGHKGQAKLRSQLLLYPQVGNHGPQKIGPLGSDGQALFGTRLAFLELRQRGSNVRVDERMNLKHGVIVLGKQCQEAICEGLDAVGADVHVSLERGHGRKRLKAQSSPSQVLTPLSANGMNPGGRRRMGSTPKSLKLVPYRALRISGSTK